MGGDIVEAEAESSLDPDFPRSSSHCSCYFRDDVGSNGGNCGEFGTKPSVKFSSCEADRRKRENIYKELLQSYDRLQERLSSLNAARLKILSYTPGAWSGRTNGVELRDCDVPETTSIVLVGPKGSGKSSLINRIVRVIENDQFAPDRAQVSCGSSSEEGTFFLQEYMVPRASPSFCLYDTRGLCENSSDNIGKIKKWVNKGVRHGKPVIWRSDSSGVKEMLNLKAQGYSSNGCKTRKINFVIFVVNTVDVLKSMESDNSTQNSYYAQMISTTFNSPFLAFEDDKPAVVMTHGDLLSWEERACARVFLGDLLGIPADKQIFDVPELRDAATELIICDLLRHCLEHADKNLRILPPKNSDKFKATSYANIIIIISMILSAFAAFMGYFHALKPNNVMSHRPNKIYHEDYVPNMGYGDRPNLWKDRRPNPYSWKGRRT